MANKGTKDIAGLYIGAVDVKGDVESANLKMSNSLSAFQPLGAVNPAPINAGTRSGTLNLTGYYNGTDTTLDSIAAQASSSVLCALLVDGASPYSGSPTLYRYYGIQGGILDSSEVQLAPSEAHKMATEVTVAGNVDFGTVVHDVTQLRSGTTGTPTDSTYADLGAVTAATGIRAHLIIPTLTLGSATNLIVKLRHSSDHSAWVDLASGAFTAATAATTQTLTVASVVNRYLSIAWTWTGSTGTSFYAFVGVAVI